MGEDVGNMQNMDMDMDRIIWAMDIAEHGYEDGALFSLRGVFIS